MQSKHLRLTLLLALGTVCASRPGPAPNLAGCWTNQLGSTVSIDVAENGILRGTYTSQVSSSGEQVKGDLIGYQQVFNQPTFGFAVKWTTESVRGSVTVWTGQMFNTDGHQTLMTMWLLRNNTETIGNNWSATRLVCGIIARSAGLFQNPKKICACDGVTLWEERDQPIAGPDRKKATEAPAANL